jgi:hypothetical protein
MKFPFHISGAVLPRLLLVAAVTTGALATVAGNGTMAWFTTTPTSDTNLFTAGTLHLLITDDDELAGALVPNTVTASIVFDNMKPGDVVYAPIEIKNTGTLPAVYGIRYTTTVTTGGDQNLAPALNLEIKSNNHDLLLGTNESTTGGTACNAANFALGTHWITSTGGAGTSAPGLMVPAGETRQTVSTQTVTAGTNTQTAAAVGRPLTEIGGLAPDEVLCLAVTFVEGAGNNTYNNAVNGNTNTIVTFIFDGLAAVAPLTNNP